MQSREACRTDSTVKGLGFRHPPGQIEFSFASMGGKN